MNPSGLLDPRDRSVAVALVLTSVYAAAFLMPWTVAATAAAAIAVFSGLTWLYNWDRRRSGQTPEALLEPEMLVFAAMGALMVATPTWLPTEQIQTRDDPARVVYVLEENDSRLTVLVDGTTRIEYIAQADVESRFVCGGGPSLFGLLDETGNEECSAR
jgi:hypothetical protein